MGWEFLWIGGEPGALQHVVWQSVDHGHPMSCHRRLGQLESFFGREEIRLIDMASFNRLQVGRLDYSSDRDVS